jgi:hypothetical protein
MVAIFFVEIVVKGRAPREIEVLPEGKRKCLYSTAIKRTRAT